MFHIKVLGIPTIKRRWSWFFFAIGLLIATAPSVITTTELFEMILNIIYITVAVMIVLVVVFMPNTIPTRDKAIKKSNSVLAMWYSGRTVLEDGLIDKYHKKIRKLILLNPKFAGGMSSRHGDTTSDEIIKTTRKALEKGIDVRWGNDPRPYTFTFYYVDNDRKAWMIWQEADEKKPYTDWKKTRYGSKSTEYIWALDQFNRIWDKYSEEPNLGSFINIDPILQKIKHEL
jgi:hypothetical protein